MIQELDDIDNECRNLPITINIEGDVKRIEVIREKCKEPVVPEEPVKPEPVVPK
jgi:hypothetical protein